MRDAHPEVVAMSVRSRLLLMLFTLGLPNFGAAHHPSTTWSAQRLTDANREWNLHLGAGGALTLRMPRDSARLDHLAPPLAAEAHAKLTQRDQNLGELRAVARRFDAAVAQGRLHLAPEYERDMSELLIAATRTRQGGAPTIQPHIPILRALPPYTRLRVFVPREGIAAVERELASLGLKSRSTLMIDDDAAPGAALTPWVRDQVLVIDGGERSILATPLRFYPGRLAESDLRHLGRLKARGREVLRIPLFFRSGNLLLARHGQRILFVGQTELFLNAVGYVQAHLSRPDSAEVLSGLRAMSGADEVIVLPNSDRLFHIDQYFAPLADGVAALLRPLDPHNLHPDDQRAIDETRKILHELGFRIIPIPTVAERIHSYQSPVNIVPFRDLAQRDRAALVPRFPDRMVQVDGRRQSLNALVAQAYRGAGIRPVEVDDNFAPLMGNTHCVAVPLH